MGVDPPKRSAASRRGKQQTAGNNQSLEAVLRGPSHKLNTDELTELFGQVDRNRVAHLTDMLTKYIGQNLPVAIEKRGRLTSYRVNPYVLFTCAKVMKMSDFSRLAEFIFNTKLYMGLETSFGKQIEAAFVGQYPLNQNVVSRWVSPPEKDAEAAALKGLPREEKAKKRTGSVWREIDRSCVVGDRRYMVSIKSGPNCINDTQVSGMVNAFEKNLAHWVAATKKSYPKVKGLDVAIGITYGTDKTTNNKENQFLIKMQDKGFEQEDPKSKPGVLIDTKTRSVRLYRRIGQDFWSMVGNPKSPKDAKFVFLEVLLALAKSLTDVVGNANLETKINLRLAALSQAFQNMMFPQKSLPEWVRQDFDDREMFWFTTAIGAFYDEGV